MKYILNDLILQPPKIFLNFSHLGPELKAEKHYQLAVELSGLEDMTCFLVLRRVKYPEFPIDRKNENGKNQKQALQKGT